MKRKKRSPLVDALETALKDAPKPESLLVIDMTFAHCSILSSAPMPCPLCGVLVQPMVSHNCSRPKTVKGPRR